MADLGSGFGSGSIFDNSRSFARANSLCEVEILRGFGERRVERNDLIDVGHLKSFLDHAICTGDAKASTGLFHLCVAHNDNAHAGAVQDGDAGEIEDNLLMIFFEEIRERPFHLLAGASQADPSGHFQNGDIRIELLVFNGENHGSHTPTGAPIGCAC